MDHGDLIKCIWLILMSNDRMKREEKTNDKEEPFYDYEYYEDYPQDTQIIKHVSKNKGKDVYKDGNNVEMPDDEYYSDPMNSTTLIYKKKGKYINKVQPIYDNSETLKIKHKSKKKGKSENIVQPIYKDTLDDYSETGNITKHIGKNKGKIKKIKNKINDGDGKVEVSYSGTQMKNNGQPDNKGKDEETTLINSGHTRKGQTHTDRNKLENSYEYEEIKTGHKRNGKTKVKNKLEGKNKAKEITIIKSGHKRKGKLKKKKSKPLKTNKVSSMKEEPLKKKVEEIKIMKSDHKKKGEPKEIRIIKSGHKRKVKRKKNKSKDQNEPMKMIKLIPKKNEEITIITSGHMEKKKPERSDDKDEVIRIIKLNPMTNESKPKDKVEDKTIITSGHKRKGKPEKKYEDLDKVVKTTKIIPKVKQEKKVLTLIKTEYKSEGKPKKDKSEDNIEMPPTNIEMIKLIPIEKEQPEKNKNKPEGNAKSAEITIIKSGLISKGKPEKKINKPEVKDEMMMKGIPEKDKSEDKDKLMKMIKLIPMKNEKPEGKDENEEITIIKSGHKGKPEKDKNKSEIDNFKDKDEVKKMIKLISVKERKPEKNKTKPDDKDNEIKIMNSELKLVSKEKGKPKIVITSNEEDIPMEMSINMLKEEPHNERNPNKDEPKGKDDELQNIKIIPMEKGKLKKDNDEDKPIEMRNNQPDEKGPVKINTPKMRSYPKCKKKLEKTIQNFIENKNFKKPLILKNEPKIDKYLKSIRSPLKDKVGLYRNKMTKLEKNNGKDEDWTMKTRFINLQMKKNKEFGVPEPIDINRNILDNRHNVEKMGNVEIGKKPLEIRNYHKCKEKPENKGVKIQFGKMKMKNVVTQVHSINVNDYKSIQNLKENEKKLEEPPILTNAHKIEKYLNSYSLRISNKEIKYPLKTN